MILDGKVIRNEILLKNKRIIQENDLHLKLAIILVGSDNASKIYIKNKVRACEEVGIEVVNYNLKEDTTEDYLKDLITNLNNNPSITGIILQNPVPKHIDFDRCSSLISSYKDVDGFTKDNIVNLYLNKECIVPCTVKGILTMLDYYNIPIEGKNVVIIGRSKIVGKPLSLAMLNRNASVTILHSKSNNLSMFTKNADILISAVGYPHLITKDMVKIGSTVIDVGISYINGRIIGDVDFENVQNIVDNISPNPGGVGPMTIAMLVDNLVMLGNREVKND